jgi:hypothetical protein
MTEPHPFPLVKLICGIIASEERFFIGSKEKLAQMHGPVDLESAQFPFIHTDYYEKQMGKGLKRKFISFERLISPEALSEIKIQTNRLEAEIREEFRANYRVVNLDPGYLTSSALILATAKGFAHRVSLQNGIYAHLEFLFGKDEVKTLDWTYPDYQTEGYQDFFLKVRRLYLIQLRKLTKEQ